MLIRTLQAITIVCLEKSREETYKKRGGNSLFKWLPPLFSCMFLCALFLYNLLRYSILLIHHINRIALEERLDVGGYLLVQALASLVGGPGNVRSEVGIRLVPERIVL